MGEGGAVYTNQPLLDQIVRSLRDWGRDCWCGPGHDGTCGHRYDGQYGELPKGYDHKYVYSHFGYNLKATDMQAAVGCAQLEKLETFIKLRKEHWRYLRQELSDTEKYLILPEPEPNSSPSWFGFLVSVKRDAGFTRDGLVGYLEQRNIQTRNLFAGNIIKHPCFDALRKTGTGYRVVGELTNTDFVMEQSFWIGVYPLMEKIKMDYMVKNMKEFIKSTRLSGYENK